MKIRSTCTKTVPKGYGNFTKSDFKSSQLVQKLDSISLFLLYPWVKKLDIFILIAISISLFRQWHTTGEALYDQENTSDQTNTHNFGQAK